MDAIIEYQLDGVFKDTDSTPGTWEVSTHLIGSVEAEVGLPGGCILQVHVEGFFIACADDVAAQTEVGSPVRVAYATDEYFKVVTDMRSGVLRYLLLQDGSRLLLEQGGYLIL